MLVFLKQNTTPTQKETNSEIKPQQAKSKLFVHKCVLILHAFNDAHVA